MVIVFDTEEKAYQGQRALNLLDADGTIAIHARAVIAKGQDGTVELREPADVVPLSLVSGSLLGSLIGVLGGPIGWAADAMTGGFLGASWLGPTQGSAQSFWMMSGTRCVLAKRP